MPSADPDERAQERVGTVLNDKWTLERLIGIGGMAAVYAGLHRNGARAAVKVLHPAYARRKDIRERFLREGYAANRVNHSGVVKVLDDDIIDSGPDEGGAYLVMEQLEGQSVEDRLERGPPIGESEVLSIMRAVLDVLDSAHKAGVVHRDLKPENLFLARDPENPAAPARIKILDFGLARVAESGGSGKTMAGVAIGTPSYMPPEQAAGRVYDIDARSDLFALGATAFRILANRTVHPAEGAMAICALMAKDPAPKLRGVAPTVSQKTAAVVDRALEFTREDRFQTAADMRAAVIEALDALGGETIPIESGMIEVSTAPPARPEKRSSSRPPAAPKRRAGSSFLLWLLLLAGAGALGKLAWDRFGPMSPAVDIADVQAPAASDAAAAAATAPDIVDATVIDAPPEVGGEPSDSSVDTSSVDDAAADADSLDAETEIDAATLDAAVSDGHVVTNVQRDAGAAVTQHRDAGAHHHRRIVHRGIHRH